MRRRRTSRRQTSRSRTSRSRTSCSRTPRNRTHRDRTLRCQTSQGPTPRAPIASSFRAAFRGPAIRSGGRDACRERIAPSSTGLALVTSAWRAACWGSASGACSRVNAVMGSSATQSISDAFVSAARWRAMASADPVATVPHSRRPRRSLRCAPSRPHATPSMPGRRAAEGAMGVRAIRRSHGATTRATRQATSAKARRVVPCSAARPGSSACSIRPTADRGRTTAGLPTAAW